MLGASGDSEAPGAGMVGLGDSGVLQWTVRCQGRRGGAGGCWGPSVDSKVSGQAWWGWGMLGASVDSEAPGPCLLILGLPLTGEAAHTQEMLCDPEFSSMEKVRKTKCLTSFKILCPSVGNRRKWACSPTPSWEATGSNSSHLSKVNLMHQRPNLLT